MAQEEDWNAFLKDHPIFELPQKRPENAGGDVSLELSLNTLPKFTQLDPVADGTAPSGRRQIMVIKDADLIVAVRNELRIASLGDSKLSRSGRKMYKTLHTPNVTFEIHQMTLNPNGKFLAVAGAFQVAVVVLPRAGFTRLVPSTIDCKSIQIGQYYHASDISPPIAKIEWHPWGQGGTTLLVMTVDGKLREYDIAEDTEEPQQVLSFVPEKKTKSYFAEDSSEREVASFTLGKGKADWGPLSVYTLMKSGDIYAISPYMPRNASIPSSYVHALECFVAAKQEFLSQAEVAGSPSSNLSALYDYQRRYVNALLRQLPPGTTFPSSSRSVAMHPPSTIKGQPLRQGPFLLQPSPRTLEGSEGGDATDIIYLAFDVEGDDIDDGETERLGLVLVAFKDGKVDVYLDVEKVEARWEKKELSGSELPMLAVYETIDLGIISTLRRASSSDTEPPLLNLLHANHPVFLRDPIHDETIYVYHAFGVHALQLATLLQNLAAAVRDDVSNDGGEGDGLVAALESSKGTTVQPILTTFSVERKCSNPVVAVAVPNDVYLTYSIFILTSAMRITVLPLTLQSEPPVEILSTSVTSVKLPSTPQEEPLQIRDGPPAYVPLLTEPFVPAPALTRPSGLPSNPRLALPPSHNPKAEFELTPDTLRYLGSTFERFMSQIREVQLAHRAAEMRAELQKQEFRRQQEKCAEMLELIEQLHGARQVETNERLKEVQGAQRALLARVERILRGLMNTASPDLSEHETKWFEELRRMREDVVGVGRYDQGALETRTALLRRELDRLLPSLKDVHEKERRLQKRAAESGQRLGVSQAFELGERSNAERAKISNLENEILKLANKLDVTLGRPPSQQGEDTDSR